MGLTPIQVTMEQDDLIFKIGDGRVVYETDLNAFQENSGLTIQNIDLGLLTGYYLKLSTINKSLSCGNMLENTLFSMGLDKKNILLILDFEKVEEVSESFLKSYTKFLLETSNKVLTINMNISISNDFGNFVLANIQEEEE